MHRFQIFILCKQRVFGFITFSLWLWVQTGSAEELSSSEWQSILSAGGEYTAENGSETMRVRQHVSGELLTLARDVTAQEIPAGAALLMSAMKGESVGTSSMADKTKPRTPPAANANIGSRPGIERVVFDLDYLYGVGGGAYPEYTAVVLFGDGTACKCLEAAIDDIDVARIRMDKPNRLGNWKKSGANYEVRWTGAAEPEILNIDVGPPTDLPDSSALRGRYQHISGGGNTALGGTVTVASAEDLTFYDDGSFSQSNLTFALSTALTSSTKRGKAGTWSLVASTLTLEYGDGNTVRTTVFYSPKRKSSADFGRYGVLWIGGEGFKRVE